MENWGRIDEPFYSGSLLQNVSAEAHFKEKFPKIVYLSAVNPSGENLGHYTYKLSTLKIDKFIVTKMQKVGYAWKHSFMYLP